MLKCSFALCVEGTFELGGWWSVLLFHVLHRIWELGSSFKMSGGFMTWSAVIVRLHNGVVLLLWTCCGGFLFVQTSVCFLFLFSGCTCTSLLLYFRSVVATTSQCVTIHRPAIVVMLWDKSYLTFYIRDTGLYCKMMVYAKCLSARVTGGGGMLNVLGGGREEVERETSEGQQTACKHRGVKKCLD